MQDIQLLNFEGQEVIDSRDVATMIGKRHTDLLRSIDNYANDIIEPDAKLRSAINNSNSVKLNDFFIKSTYKDKNNQIRPCYLLTKLGCEFVANKMTGKRGNQFTAKYVTLFNQMKKSNPMELIYEKWDIPRTYGGALQLAANQAKLLEKQKPKVEYYDSQMRNPGLMTTTEIAKDYGWSATRLNQELRRRRVIYPRVRVDIRFGYYIATMQAVVTHNTKHLPMKKAMPQGCTTISSGRKKAKSSFTICLPKTALYQRLSV